MNVQHRILNKVFYQFINWRSDPPDPAEGEADGGQATKIRRALSTARDGGQERFHYSMFNVRCLPALGGAKGDQGSTFKKCFTLPFNILAGTVKHFRIARAEPVV